MKDKVWDAIKGAEWAEADWRDFYEVVEAFKTRFFARHKEIA